MLSRRRKFRNRGTRSGHITESGELTLSPSLPLTTTSITRLLHQHLPPRIQNIPSYSRVPNRKTPAYLNNCLIIKPLLSETTSQQSSHPPHISIMGKGGTATGQDWEKYQKKFAVSSRVPKDEDYVANDGIGR